MVKYILQDKPMLPILQDKILLCLNSVASLETSSYTKLVLCYLGTAFNKSFRFKADAGFTLGIGFFI